MSESSTYKLKITIPNELYFSNDETQVSDREEFFEWLWKNLSTSGLIGVHEGTVLSEEAAQKGMETESWTVDSGEAPRERDWVGNQDWLEAELFFKSLKEAEKASALLQSISEIKIGLIEEQKNQDWDAEWKASFLNAGEGVLVPPFWRIVPPWKESVGILDEASNKLIKINPGAGFGTGTHETTQLCLEAIGEFSQKVTLQAKKALDFGSGSGILSVALALLGARVDAVEIDPLAIDNAIENSSINSVENQIHFYKNLQPTSDKKYSYIIANILRPVLIEFSKELISRLESEGVLILSGLIEKDVEPVIQVYQTLLGISYSRVYTKGDWRAIVFVNC